VLWHYPVRRACLMLVVRGQRYRIQGLGGWGFTVELEDSMRGSGWWGPRKELLDRLVGAAESLNLPAIHKQHHCRTNTLQLHNTQEI